MYTCTKYKIKTSIGEFIEKIYTYDNKDDAIINSMGYSICRYEHDMKWIYYYHGNQINIEIIERVNHG